MDTPNGTRARGRKNHTLPTASSSSSQNSSELAMQQPSSAPTSFSYSPEIASPSASRETRMRARAIDSVATTNTAAPTTTDDLANKGGRSLRKRPRVDYTFDQLDDLENHATKSSPIASRSLKKRKTDLAANENEINEDFEVRSKRRASEQPQPSSSRRRNTRKSTVEPQVFVPEQQADDVEVQDTIEVGGHHSDPSEESILRRTSSGSSINDSKAPAPSALLDSPILSRPSQSSEPTLPSLSSDIPKDSPSDNKKQPKQQREGQDEAAVEDGIESREYGDEQRASGALPNIDGDHAEPDSLEYLTPYMGNAFVYYPDYQGDEPDPDPEPEADGDADINPEDEADLNADPVANPDLEPDVANEDVAEGVAAAKDVVAEETPADTAANSPSADADPPGTQPTDMKLFRFKETRPAAEFVDLFKDIKSLSADEIYRRLEITNRALQAWQNEHKELRKFTDDHDNSIRYQKEEESFQRRFKAATGRDPSANPVRKDFVVKGVRAQDNTDPLEAYARQQDRIMANVYGFEYDPSAARIGKQNPIAQRTGVGRHGRLRERPKQTAKAAEADEPTIIQGKRTRKAPERFNGGEAPSRGSTPAPSQRRGRRGAQAQDNDDQNSARTQNQTQAQNQNEDPAAPEPVAEPVAMEGPKKKGKGGRPRKNPIPPPEPAPTPAAEPESEAESEPQPLPAGNGQSKALPKIPIKSQAKSRSKAQPKTEPELQPNAEHNPEPKPSLKREAEQDAEEQPGRKRRRRAPASTPVATTTPAAEEEDDAPGGTEARAPAKPTRQRNSRKAENPSGSFSAAHTPMTSNPYDHQAEQPRPPTASSTATAETVASTSNYQLREKRQRKFTNDFNDDDFIEEPKRKRTRRAPKKTGANVEEPAPAPEAPPASKAEPDAAPAPKPPTKIRLKVKRGDGIIQPPPAPTLGAPSLGLTAAPAPTRGGNNVNGKSNGSVGGDGATDANNADGEAGGDPSKNYDTMTKSEKMSYSMKARWASGSMNVAVAKRRATLAAKKQGAKQPAAADAAGCGQGQGRGAAPDEDDDDSTARGQ